MATGKIPRSMQQAREAMDPQNWDGCSEFWCPNGTCLVDKDPVVKDDKCAMQQDSPQEIPGEPLGGVYTGKRLFEPFSCLAPACDAEFCNPLLVTAAETEPPSS